MLVDYKSTLVLLFEVRKTSDKILGREAFEIERKIKSFTPYTFA